jgi:hypothetical protein
VLQALDPLHGLEVVQNILLAYAISPHMHRTACILCIDQLFIVLYSEEDFISAHFKAVVEKYHFLCHLLLVLFVCCLLKCVTSVSGSM